jgi:hypothetical protein
MVVGLVLAVCSTAAVIIGRMRKKEIKEIKTV